MKNRIVSRPEGYGSRIRAYRERKGWTQAQLVERMSIHSSEKYGRKISEDLSKIARWEREEQQPTAHHLRVLCDVLEVTPADLGL
jgi:transcriptional regulator with XRE-family HTH domain